MKIALVGITGKNGSQIAPEAKKRGHAVAASRSLIADASGHSQIACGDYADAFVTEIEAGLYRKEIATAAY